MSRNTALRTSKNMLMLLTGTLTRMVASFAFVVYAAASLGVEGFGKFSIASLYFELFLSLVATAVGILLTRDGARWQRHLPELLTSATICVLILCAVAPLVMLPMAIGFGYSTDTFWAIGLSAVALLPASLCVLMEAVFVARERAEFVTLGNVIESLLRIAASFAILKLGYGILELVGALLVARIILLGAYGVALRHVMPVRWSFCWSRTRRFALRWRVFSAENWMATVYTSLDALLLSWIAGETASGLYSAAGKLVRLGTVIAKSYTTAIFPVMSRMYGVSRESFRQLFQHTVRVMLSLAIPAIVGISVMADRIVVLLYKDEYVDSVPVLRVLIWVLLVEFLNPFLSHVLFAQGRQHRSMYVAAISLLANSVASYLLISQFGAVGAACASVFGGVVAMCCYLRFTMSWAEILSTSAMAIRILIAACGMGLVVHLIRQQSWGLIGIVSLLVYGVLLLLVQVFRREDLLFFKSTFSSRAAT